MGCQMAEYLDFFNRYVMGVTEISVQFYFLSKILNKKVWALSSYGIRNFCLPRGF